VQVAFVDGSIHFINSSIKLPVWQSLVTRAGGEVATEY
jgi:hypothetical protein